MSEIAQKLNYLAQTKDLIREAIESKGVEVLAGATFRDYAGLISAISAGENTGGRGIITKLTIKKLNIMRSFTVPSVVTVISAEKGSV